MKNLLVLIAFCLVVSCKSEKAKEVVNEVSEPTLMEQAVELHDALMNDMGKMVDLEMTLELASKDSIPELLERQKRVTAANKEMFAWMTEFGQAFTFEEINKGAALTPEKEALLVTYHERISKLKAEFEDILKDE